MLQAAVQLVTRKSVRRRQLHAWAAIIADSLDWDQAHSRFADAVAGIPVDLRGIRPEGLQYSPWELVEHIRVAQHDLLEFCRNQDYRHDLKWPADYWPGSKSPPSDEAWVTSLEHVQHDSAALAAFAKERADSLTDRIPWGTGQTYLRTVLVALDHNAYHLGQLVTVRKLLGAWPPPESSG
jgi:hypothetical protein